MGSYGWAFHHGGDDTFNEDLSLGFRSYNDVIQANVFYTITPRLVAALEASRWKTNWVGASVGRVVRVEPTAYFMF